MYFKKNLYKFTTQFISLFLFAFLSGCGGSDNSSSTTPTVTPPTISAANVNVVENEECYQTHHNLITDQEQVPIYQSVMADTNNRITYTLLHANNYLKDNRIPPVGFSTNDPRFDLDTAVVGLAINDDDFNKDNGTESSGKDVVHYALANFGALTGIRVKTNLWYQSITLPFIEALVHNGKDAARFKKMASDNPEPAKLIATLDEWHDL